MTVYVDDMRREASTGRRIAKWSHLMADTSAELEAFARQLGLRPEWLQHPGTHREHYDVTEYVRRKAVAAGAVEITYPRGTGELLARKRKQIENRLWFASWSCNCTVLAPTREDIADRCPEHDAHLLAPPAVTFIPHKPGQLGVRPDHRKVAAL